MHKDSDVEDVLSSVRRLVSGEIKGARRAPSQALVLGPAQRVSEAAEARRTQTLEDRIAELEAQLSARDDEWEPDGSEDQSSHRPTQIIDIPRSRPRSGRVEEEDAPRRDADVFVLSQPVEPTPDRPLRRLSRIEPVEGETDEGETAEDARTDTEPQAADAESRGSAEATPTEADFDTDLARAVAHSVEAALDDVAQELAAEEERHSARIEAVIDEAAAREVAGQEPEVAESGADIPGDAENDTPDTRDAQPEMAETTAQSLAAATALDATLAELERALEPRLDPEPPAVAPPEPEPETPATATPEAGTAPSDTALRALVSELIREELQGELGARITRNVRKLVRREIQRAFAARDLS